MGEQTEEPGDATGRAICVVGLGNPGPRYGTTPHNVGFLVIDELSKRHGIPVTKLESNAFTGTGRIGDRNVLLAMPQTFMNRSGEAVAPLLSYRNLTPRDLLVVYDELDLPWTALRIKKSGSAAGHNGVKSIIAALKTDVFTRIRVGIHPGHEIDAATYVLALWERGLRGEIGEVVSYTADAAESVIAEGADKAMAKFNRRAGGSLNEDE